MTFSPNADEEARLFFDEENEGARTFCGKMNGEKTFLRLKDFSNAQHMFP